MGLKTCPCIPVGKRSEVVQEKKSKNQCRQAVLGAEILRGKK